MRIIYVFNSDCNAIGRCQCSSNSGRLCTLHKRVPEHRCITRERVLYSGKHMVAIAHVVCPFICARNPLRGRRCIPSRPKCYDAPPPPPDSVFSYLQGAWSPQVGVAIKFSAHCVRDLPLNPPLQFPRSAPDIIVETYTLTHFCVGTAGIYAT